MEMQESIQEEKLTIEQIGKVAKINWTNFYAEFNDCQNDSPIEFEIMPEEYLEFAKNNLKKNTKQNCIDAMGNAKRSIECQIDMLINTLGYDYKQFDLRNTYSEAKSFIKQNYKDEQYTGLTDRLKLLNILGLAPTLILSNIRSMRNQMEHEYSVPSYDEVKKAIEVADLFINSSNRKFSYSPTVLEIGNKLKSDDELEIIRNYTSFMCPFIRIRFVAYNSVNKVHIYVVKQEILPLMKDNNTAFITPEEHKISIELKPEDKFYIESIYSLLNWDCNLIPMIFGANIEDKYINYTCI